MGKLNDPQEGLNISLLLLCFFVFGGISGCFGGVWGYFWEVFGSVLEGFVWYVERFSGGKHKEQITY